MSEPIPASRVRRAVAFSVALLVAMAALFGGAAYVWATRPIASEAQIADAAARVQQARRAPVEACPRPVLRGVALPGDGAEGVRELADWQGLTLPCFEYLGRYVFRAQRLFLVLRSTPRLATAEPLAFERDALQECSGLDAVLQAALQRESGCTAQPLFLEARVVDIPHLELMMFVLARAHIHAGRVQEGMELLLDVIRLGQDFTRGDASLVPVHVGLQLEFEAARQLEALLASDLPWTPAMLDELARQARVLTTTMPEPALWFQHNEVWVRHHALDELHGPAAEVLADGAALDIAVADYGETRWPACTQATQTCITRHRAAIIDAYGPVPTLARFGWIPGVVREVRVRSAYGDRLHEREAVLMDAAHNEALLRALPVLFLHRRMSLSGTCPTAEALQAAARASGLEGVEVQPSTESLQPLHLRTTAAPEAHLRAYCPALHEHDTASGGLP